MANNALELVAIGEDFAHQLRHLPGSDRAIVGAALLTRALCDVPDDLRSIAINAALAWVRVAMQSTAPEGTAP